MLYLACKICFKNSQLKIFSRWGNSVTKLGRGKHFWTHTVTL